MVLVLALGGYSKNPILGGLDFFFYDRFMKSAVANGDSYPMAPITIIDIDETSLSAVGQWPWPRYQLAQLVGAVAQMNPKAIGLDILLPEPDRTSLINIKTQFEKDFSLNLGFTGVPPTLGDNDAYAAQVLKKAGVVGTRYFYFDHFNKQECNLKNPFKIIDTTGLLVLHRATGVLLNVPSIEDSLEFAGFMNNQQDGDGILRQTPLLIEFQGNIFPNLALSTLIKGQKVSQVMILKDFYGLFIKVGEYKIPITQEGYMQLGFAGHFTRYKFVSAMDLLNNMVPPADILGKNIFIGSSAVGLNDVHHTLFDSQFPGVAVQAVILDNILKGKQIIRPLWSEKIIFTLSLLTGMVMLLLFFRLPGTKAFFAGTMAWICLIFLLSFISYLKLSVFVSPGIPLLTGGVMFSFLSYVRFVHARQTAFLWFKQLASSQQLTMEAMVSMVETRDPETGQHIQRTQHYAKSLALHLKKIGKFSEILTEDYIELLFLSAPLHDIGKVGIPDNILLKPGKLTAEEFETMKTHAAQGQETIEKVAKKIKGDNYLEMGAEIAGSHHERWDGKGYPRGLAMENIPLAGRIMAISDVYDALISRRCYKPPFTHERSMAILGEGKGSLFDPVIVDAFFTIEPEIKAIAARFKDPGVEKQDGKATNLI